MKTFKKSKSPETLRKEAVLQQKASVVGVAPVILEYDTVSKFIVMEKMDKSFIDSIRKQKGIVTKNQQKQILNLFQKLDECKVFHGDANIMNYMQKGKRLYMIDYGFSKEITPKFIKLYKTETPNMKIMLLGLILKLKELRCNPISWELLITYISEEDKIKCDL
jgi:tRNA A-37 threonylcarbamoyl transferase component Bud32